MNAITCAVCHGRRFIDGLVCERCNGNGRVPVIAWRTPREIARHNLAIAVVILGVILAVLITAIAVLT